MTAVLVNGNWSFGTNFSGSKTVIAGGGGTGGLSTDTWKRPQLMPQVGRAWFGYYDRSHAPTAFEAAYGRVTELDIVYNVGGFAPSAATAATVRALLARGTMPRVDLAFNQFVDVAVTVSGVTTHYRKTKVSQFWSTIASGALDADFTFSGKNYEGITTILTNVLAATNKQQIFMSLWHEMDGLNDGGGTAADATGFAGGSTKVWFGADSASSGDPSGAAAFRAAWQHVVTLTRSICVANGYTEPVWYFDPAYNAAGDSTHTKWGDTLTDTGSDGFYPGHSYVDWVGADPYNYAGNATHGNRWDTPLDLWNLYGGAGWWDLHFKVGGARTSALAVGSQGVYKPMMWGETGTNEYWAGAPYNSSAYVYSSHSAADGTAGDWIDQLIYLMTNPASAAYGKLCGAQWLGVDYSGGTFVPPPGSGGMKNASGAGISDTRIFNNNTYSAQKWAKVATSLATAPGLVVRS